MTQPIKRTVFFVSDGTGLTAEALGHSLLTQFEAIEFKQIRIPFLDNVDKAHDAVARINAQSELDGMRSIVFTTLINQEISSIVHQTLTACRILSLSSPHWKMNWESNPVIRWVAHTALPIAQTTKNALNQSTTRWLTMTGLPIVIWPKRM
jgi:hypothetical protein